MQPKKIGRYEIKKRLGAGGMGSVYCAFDPQGNRDVALKVINLAAIQRFSDEKQEEVLKRFYHEVRVIGQLQHVAIVPLFDSGDDNGTPYMVMPLMAGGSLEKHLHDQNGQPQPLPFAEIERILTWITPALDKMHAQKVVHRDLKPDNILFDDEHHPYIADFGIAKLTEGSITFNTGQIGTPAYMSPEQAHGKKKVDPRSDVYSLGAVLYKMLTGERPYHRAHPAILPLYHIEKPPPRLDELRSDLSANWQAIIDCAMAKKPEERYQTAGELSRAVTQLLRDEAEREAREHKAREEAARQAEFAHLRREAEAARRQADMAREQPWREKPQRERDLRQAKEERREYEVIIGQAKEKRQEHEVIIGQAIFTISTLSTTNPLDHLRLLWWILVTPQELKRYQEQYGKEAIIPTGIWLISTLTWSPLLFPILALGLETLPHGPRALPSTVYLSISGGLSIAWLLTGLFGKKNDSSLVGVLAFGVAGIVMFGVAAGAEAGVIGVVGGVVGGVAGVVALGVALVVGRVVALGIPLVVVRGVAGIVMFGVALVVVLGVIAGVVAGEVVFGMGLLMTVAVVGDVAHVVEKSVESGQPSWLARGMFGLLVAAYAFLLWFCFLGGWKAFA